MNWNRQAQDKGSWRALVNAVMNLGFHKIWVISSVAVLASQEFVCLFVFQRKSMDEVVK